MLKTTLEPFNDIEDIANTLGIPFESSRDHMSPRRATSNPLSKSSSSTNPVEAANLDPRSPEFQELLNRISASFLFLRSHKEIRDSGKYLAWLEKLQNRATSLVAKAIRELLEKASKACADLHQQKLYNRAHSSTSSNSNSSNSNNGGPSVQISAHSVGKGGVDDSPIESAPIYQKFRGLSFRVRELTLLLRKGDIASAAAVRAVLGSKKRGSVSSASASADDLPATLSGAAGGGGNSVHVSVRGEEVVNEIKLVYVQIRNELLLPFANDTWLAGLAPTSTSPNPTDPGAVRGAVSLCSSIRLAYATLLRITQLEQQLFESLFNIDQELSPIGDSLGLVIKPADEAANLTRANQSR